MTDWPAIETDYLETLTRRGPPRAPASLGEIWSAEWSRAGLDTVTGVNAPLGEATRALEDAIAGEAGADLGTLAAAKGIAINQPAVDARIAALGRLADTLPEEARKRIEPLRDVRKAAADKAQAIERDAAEVARGTYGLSGTAMSLLAGIARQTTDPVNLGLGIATGPIGGEIMAGRLLAVLSRQAAAGAVSQAVVEPLIEPARERLGLDAGPGRAAGNIAEAAIGSAALAGLFRGAGAVLARVWGRPGHVPEPGTMVSAQPAAPAPPAAQPEGAPPRQASAEPADAPPAAAATPQAPATEKPAAAPEPARTPATAAPPPMEAPAAPPAPEGTGGRRVGEEREKSGPQHPQAPTLPAAESDVVRFYHGGPPEGGDAPSAGGGRWVSPDYVYARDYRRDADRPGQVWYVDIPKGDPAEVAARGWDEIDEAGQTNMVGRYRSIELPEEWARQMRPVPAATPAAPPAPEGTGGRRVGEERETGGRIAPEGGAAPFVPEAPSNNGLTTPPVPADLAPEDFAAAAAVAERDLVTDPVPPDLDLPAPLAAERMADTAAAMEAGKPLAEPDDGAPAIAVQPKRKVGAAAKREDELTAIEYLALKGGLRRDDPVLGGDLSAIFDGRGPMIPGVGPLLRRRSGPGAAGTGRTLEEALTLLKEGGYLHDPADEAGGLATLSINDVLDVLDRSARGEKIYRLDRGDLADRAARSNMDLELQADRLAGQFDARMVELGFDGEPGRKITRGLRSRALEIMDREGGDPLAAYEQAILEAEIRKDAARQIGSTPFEDIPFPELRHVEMARDVQLGRASPEGGGGPGTGGAAAESLSGRSGGGGAGGAGRPGGDGLGQAGGGAGAEGLAAAPVRGLADLPLPAQGTLPGIAAAPVTARPEQLRIPGTEPADGLPAGRAARRRNDLPPRRGLFDDAARAQGDLMDRLGDPVLAREADRIIAEAGADLYIELPAAGGGLRRIPYSQAIAEAEEAAAAARALMDCIGIEQASLDAAGALLP